MVTRLYSEDAENRAQPDPESFAGNREPAGGKLRFAVGAPDGPRSATWVVFGDRKRDEVYLGLRSQSHLVKLSLHASGDWRWAYTSEAARAADQLQDRVLLKFERPAPIMPGWLRAATIVVPASRLSLRVDRKPPRPSQHMTWWPPPPEGNAIAFEVILPDPESAGGPLFVPGVMGEVGHLLLPSGRPVIVLVRPMMRSELEVIEGGFGAALDEIWRQMEDDAPVENDAFAITEGASGQPLIFDGGRWQEPAE